MVGLARSRPFELAPGQGYEPRPLLMEQLNDSPSLFTFSFDSSQTSGSPFNSVQPTPVSDWPAVKMNNDFFWSTRTTGVRFGNSQGTNTFGFPYDDYYKAGGVE